MQNTSSENQPVRLQIEMKPETIIVRVKLYEGVLIETRFEGYDPYSKFLTYLKSISSGDNIHVLLHIAN